MQPPSPVRHNRHPLAAILLGGFLFLFAMNSQSPAADLSGQWCGHWQSGLKDHCGPLKAAFCKIDDDHYQVRFSGRFWKIFPFRYTVMLDVTKREPEKVYLSGSHQLRLFGTFHYDAQATESTFTATYTSEKDHGTFLLNRSAK